MAARVWNTAQLRDVAKMAVEGGYLLDCDREMTKIITPDRKHTVLTALKTRGRWIVRYDETVFGSSK